MTRNHLAVLLLIGISLVSSGYGQSSPNLENGFKHWGSYDSSKIDTVNNLNGNQMLHAPLTTEYGQRGDLSVQDFVYQTSKTWQTVCQGNGSGGTTCGWQSQWSGVTYQQTPAMTLQRTVNNSGNGGGSGTHSAFGYSITSADGSNHQLSAVPGTADSTGEATQFDSLDTSGYHVVMSVSDVNGVMTTATVTDRHGSQYVAVFPTSGSTCHQFSANNLGGVRMNGGVIQALVDDAPLGDSYCPQQAFAQQVTDRNGNQITSMFSASGTDTLNRPLAVWTQTTTTDFSGCSSGHTISSAFLAGYAAPDGTTRQIKICNAMYTIQTAFNAGGFVEAQNFPAPHNSQQPQVVTMVLADGTKWTFDYDSYGNVTFVGLPSGGSISYTWITIGFPSCSAVDGGVSRAIATRTVNDNNGHSYTTFYTWGSIVNGVISNTVTDANSNDTVHTFTALDGTNLGQCTFHETRTQFYQGTGSGRQLLRQEDTTYSSATFNIETGQGTATGNVVPTSIQTTLFPSNKVKLVTKAYDSGPNPTAGTPIFGNVVDEKEYDWGQGAPGTLLRETVTTYEWQVNSNYLTAHMVDLPASVVVKDGSGNRIAETDYSYDETGYLTAANISTQHTSPPGSVRGNPTTVSRWLNTTNMFIASHANWYDTGEVYQQIDPLGHATTHSYDSAYVGAFSTKTCNALSQCVSGTYDFNTGVLTSLTDANATQQAVGNTQGDAQHTSIFGYDYMFRLTSAQGPVDPANGSVRAQTSFTYSAPNSFPLSVQKTRSITTTTNDVSTAYFDGLGRPYKVTHVLPNGTSNVDSVYDGLGQVVSVSNPYFTTSDPTYGLTLSNYDALGRVTQTTKQDGSLTAVDYSAGNCTVATDEAGNSRRSCSDGIGRLTEVDEPQPNSTGTQATASVQISGSLGNFQTAAPPPAASGSGLGGFTDSSGGQHWAYLSSSSHVYNLYWTLAGGYGFDDVTGVLGAPSASGNALTAFPSGAEQWAYFGSNQHVYNFYWNSGSGYGYADATLASGSPLAATAALAGFADAGGAQHWAFLGSNQHLYDIYWTGGVYGYGDVTAGSGAPAAAAGGTLTDFGDSSGGQHWAYLDANQHIQNLYWNPSSGYGYGDVTAGSGAPVAAAGSSIVGFADSSGGQHWAYLGTNQHLYNLYWTAAGGYAYADVTAASGAPVAAAGSPVTGFADSSGGQHWAYLGTNQHAYNLYWSGGAYGYADATTASGAPVANTGSPLISFADSSGGQHWAYFGTNQHVYNLWWVSGNYAYQDVNANTDLVPDSGTVSLTVGTYTATACFGASTNAFCNGKPVNHTATDVAAAMTQALNASSSPVTATSSGSTITLHWKIPGPFTPAVSALNTTHDTPAWFPGPSFISQATNFSGGAGNIGSSPYVTTYQYNGRGDLLCVHQKATDTTADVACTGSTAPSVPASWRQRFFTYDSLSRLLTASNPESGTISYAYDNDGNLLQKTSPQANQTATATTTVSYCYDVLHRFLAKGYVNSPTAPPICTSTAPYLSNAVVVDTYDQGANAIGHLSSFTDPAGTASFSYDVLQRLSSETRTISGVSKTIGYTFNLDSSLKTLTYPSTAVITYAPDTAGRIVSAIDSGNNINYVTGAVYDATSALTSFVSGGNITNRFSFNNRLQPINMSAATASQTVFSIGYDFHLGNGNNGNVFGITNYKDSTRNQSFTYDSLNRLTSAQNTGTDCTVHLVDSHTKFWGNSYTYDAWGNLTQKSVTKCSSESLSVAVDTNNRITAFGYDTAGNQVNDGQGHTATFDQENRITSVLGYTYLYDGDGNRVQKSNGTTGTIYWYMTPGIVAESDLTGALKSEYVFFNGERVARKDFPGNTVAYYFSDHLKTASVITDSAGTIKSESDYYPWGGELQFSNGDSNHYKFTGKERDAETGLDYFGARYYSNALGRWISADWSSTPIPVPYADFGDPQSLNLYGYVRDTPTTRLDTDGHCCDTLAGMAKGAWNFVKNTVVGTVQLGAAIWEDGGNPLHLNTSLAVAMPIVNAVEDYSAKGVSGVVNQLLDQGTEGAMDIVTEAVLSGGLAATARVGGAAEDPVPGAARSGETADTALGRQKHAEFADKVRQKEGWKSEPRLTDPKTGKPVKPDAVSKGGRPVELKPKTASGRAAGRTQLKKYERATGKKGRVVYYDKDKK